MSVHVYRPTVSAHISPDPLKKSISEPVTTTLPEPPVPQAPRAVCVTWYVVAVSVSFNKTQAAFPSKSLTTDGGMNQSPSSWAGSGPPDGEAAGSALAALDGVGSFADDGDSPHDEARRTSAHRAEMTIATIGFEVPDPRGDIPVSIIVGPPISGPDHQPSAVARSRHVHRLCFLQ